MLTLSTPIATARGIPQDPYADLLQYANDALDVTVGISSWLGNTATVLFADRIAQINAAMAELDASGSYTVQTVDLSGFTNYA